MGVYRLGGCYHQWLPVRVVWEPSTALGTRGIAAVFLSVLGRRRGWGHHYHHQEVISLGMLENRNMHGPEEVGWGHVRKCWWTAVVTFKARGVLFLKGESVVDCFVSEETRWGGSFFLNENVLKDIPEKKPFTIVSRREGAGWKPLNKCYYYWICVPSDGSRGK